MTLNHLTNVINRAYTDYNMDLQLTGKVPMINPIVQLAQEQENKLKQGDGQKKNPEEYKQTNSSTGLAVNYYKILQNTLSISNLYFEEKVEKPLKKGLYANLDVAYKLNGKQVFVESKFLEPYYSGNDENRQSYFEPDKYSANTPCIEQWIALFSKAQSFLYYNFSQLCRHLLAIYKHHQKHPNEEIVLQSVTWKMTDKFLQLLDIKKRKEMEERLEILEKEGAQCQTEITNFIKAIHWDKMTFEAKHYNDMLPAIKGGYYTEFCLRYFL